MGEQRDRLAAALARGRARQRAEQDPFAWAWGDAPRPAQQPPMAPRMPPRGLAPRSPAMLMAEGEEPSLLPPSGPDPFAGMTPFDSGVDPEASLARFAGVEAAEREQGVHGAGFFDPFLAAGGNAQSLALDVFDPSRPIGAQNRPGEDRRWRERGEYFDDALAGIGRFFNENTLSDFAPFSRERRAREDAERDANEANAAYLAAQQGVGTLEPFEVTVEGPDPLTRARTWADDTLWTGLENTRRESTAGRVEARELARLARERGSEEAAQFYDRQAEDDAAMHAAIVGPSFLEAIPGVGAIPAAAEAGVAGGRVLARAGLRAAGEEIPEHLLPRLPREELPGPLTREGRGARDYTLAGAAGGYAATDGRDGEFGDDPLASIVGSAGGAYLGGRLHGALRVGPEAALEAPLRARPVQDVLPIDVEATPSTGAAELAARTGDEDLLAGLTPPQPSTQQFTGPQGSIDYEVRPDGWHITSININREAGDGQQLLADLEAQAREAGAQLMFGRRHARGSAPLQTPQAVNFGEELDPRTGEVRPASPIDYDAPDVRLAGDLDLPSGGGASGAPLRASPSISDDPLASIVRAGRDNGNIVRDDGGIFAQSSDGMPRADATPDASAASTGSREMPDLRTASPDEVAEWLRHGGDPRLEPGAGRLRFEDVPTERWRQMKDAAIVGEEDVPLSQLISIQRHLRRDFDPAAATAAYDQRATGLPDVFRADDGSLYILDGHNRLTGAAMRGDTVARVRVRGAPRHGGPERGDFSSLSDAMTSMEEAAAQTRGLLRYGEARAGERLATNVELEERAARVARFYLDRSTGNRTLATETLRGQIGWLRRHLDDVTEGTPERIKALNEIAQAEAALRMLEGPRAFPRATAPDGSAAAPRSLRSAESQYSATETPVPSNEGWQPQDFTPEGGWDSYGGDLMARGMVRRHGPEGAYREIEQIFAQRGFRKQRERIGDYGAWEATRARIHEVYRQYQAAQRRAGFNVIENPANAGPKGSPLEGDPLAGIARGDDEPEGIFGPGRAPREGRNAQVNDGPVNGESARTGAEAGTDDDFLQSLPTNPEQWREIMGAKPWINTPARAQLVIMANAQDAAGRFIYSLDDMLNVTGFGRSSENAEQVLRTVLSQARSRGGVPIRIRTGGVGGSTRNVGGNRVAEILNIAERAMRANETIEVSDIGRQLGITANAVSQTLTQIRHNARSFPQEITERLRRLDESGTFGVRSTRRRTTEDPLGLILAGGALGGAAIAADQADAQEQGEELTGLDMVGASKISGRDQTIELEDGTLRHLSYWQMPDGRLVERIIEQNPHTQAFTPPRFYAVEQDATPATDVPDAIDSSPATDAFGDEPPLPDWLRLAGTLSVGLVSRRGAEALGARGVARDLSAIVPAAGFDALVTQGEDPSGSALYSLAPAIAGRAGDILGPMLLDGAEATESIARIVRSPDFEARRDAFAAQLSDEAPALRATEVKTASVIDGRFLAPREEMIEQGYTRNLEHPIDRGSTPSPRQQFLELDDEDQAWWMLQQEALDQRLGRSLPEPDTGNMGFVSSREGAPSTPALPASDGDPLATIPPMRRRFRSELEDVSPRTIVQRAGSRPAGDTLNAFAERFGIERGRSRPETAANIKRAALADPRIRQAMKDWGLAALLLAIGGGAIATAPEDGDPLAAVAP